jgi:hypothetical protein
MPSHFFGVELEMTGTSAASSEELAVHLRDNGVACKAEGYTKETTLHWKIVPDASIMCSPGVPCEPIEIVSPKLTGGEGLTEIHKVLGLLVHPEVNKTTGFHVHIDATDFSLEQMKRIAQHYVKYEEAFDTLMPCSRRGDSNKYIQSNRQHMLANTTGYQPKTNATLFQMISGCNTLDELRTVVNPASKGASDSSSRYYKFNLCSPHNTIEFRQHSGTCSYAKISNWVRLTMQFVVHGATNTAASPQLGDGSTQDAPNPEQLLHELFKVFEIDEKLQTFYHARAEEFGPSCTGCGSGFEISGIQCGKCS